MWRWLPCAFLVVAGCTTVLGIDEDYQPMPPDGGTGTGTATPSGTPTGAGGSSTGGTAGTGGVGGGTGGSSSTLLPNGSPCDDPALCASDHCVDDLCCDQECGDTCASCSSADTGEGDGTCHPIPAYEDPAGECPTDYACSGEGSCLRDDGVECVHDHHCISNHCDGDRCAPAG